MKYDKYEEMAQGLAFMSGCLIFISSWIYCIANYGFLFGLGLGWFPSIIVAFIGGFFIGYL
jgi:hypothetical protein